MPSIDESGGMRSSGHADLVKPVDTRGLKPLARKGLRVRAPQSAPPAPLGSSKRTDRLAAHAAIRIIGRVDRAGTVERFPRHLRRKTADRMAPEAEADEFFQKGVAHDNARTVVQLLLSEE